MAGYAGAVRVVDGQRRAMAACPSGAGSLCPCGVSPPFLLRATARGVCRARGGSRAYSLERRQASRDRRHDGVLSALGAAAELAGNGARVPDRWDGGSHRCAWNCQSQTTALARLHQESHAQLPLLPHHFGKCVIATGLKLEQLAQLAAIASR